MGLGYLMLAVKSERDDYLVGNPQFTYFKSVYKRHTNFAMDYQELRFPSNTNNISCRKIYLDIPKNADLLHRMYLILDIDYLSKNVPPFEVPFVYNLIEYIDFYIGDQLIDRHYASWYHLWHELLEPDQKSFALGEMVSVYSKTSPGNDPKKLILPLRFWFNNNIGLSLPLIALSNNKIKLEVQFADFPAPITCNQVTLLIENIYLDQDERRSLVTNKQEYLITQVQTSLNNTIPKYVNGAPDLRYKIPLNLRHPVKELFWTIQSSNGGIRPADQFKYWNGSVGDQMSACTLVINGQELMDELPAPFFRDVQQYQYYGSYGMSNINQFPEFDGSASGIYSYSFSVYPTKFQPSGSLNFSKLDNAQLKMGLTELNDKCNRNIVIYGVNYNILRVESGMAGLAFVN
mgnify:CR=1 FL=1|tara:strand:- start:6141 stop:7352 length:1212 start_codon:yes stop_codon:yes gene_type:complete